MCNLMLIKSFIQITQGKVPKCYDTFPGRGDIGTTMQHVTQPRSWLWGAIAVGSKPSVNSWKGKRKRGNWEEAGLGGSCRGKWRTHLDKQWRVQ